MKKIMKNKAIILLSGGLDSTVSIAATPNLNYELALTFDYGQKSFQKEFESAKKIAEFYQIKHRCIKLDWLKDITNTTLVSDEKVPEITEEKLDNKTITTESMKQVWVPNRNGVFISIAASFADSWELDYIVIGANKEEAATFSDNSQTFVNDMNKLLETSTNYDVKVVAPLINFNKNEIIKLAVENKAPLNLINSCYNKTSKHCGNCESCNRLKRALAYNGCYNIIEELFNK